MLNSGHSMGGGMSAIYSGLYPDKVQIFIYILGV
jgi:pimeloyl-ACP methyl ester carboxylesterase